MLNNTENIIIAVSGGVDSISLLHFFVNNFKEKKISVAHVNHNLRGEESDRDELFVKDVCNKWKIDFICKSANVLEISKINRTGIEETARKVRYDFFKEISQNNNSKVATAHTLSDSIETFIFNFSRGTGLQGLCGIPPIRDNIIRPLIYVSRNEIQEYSKRYNLKYVTDSSNLIDKYSRNKIRHFIVPEIKKINKSFENNSNNCMVQLREENNFLDEISNKEFEKCNFEVNKINELHKVIKKRVIKKILNYFDSNIKYKYIYLMDNLLNSRLTSFEISKDRTIKIKNGFIVCESKKDYKLTIRKKKFIILNLDGENLKNMDKYDRKMLVNLKSDTLHFKFRNREQGDVFLLPIRNCTKSLKKLFNEYNIPLKLREQLGILFDEKRKEIAWIESFGPSKNYLASEECGKIGLIKEIE